MTSPLFTYVSRLALVFAAALLMGASSTAALAQPQPSQAAAQPSPSAQASQAPVSVSSISASFYPNPTDSGAFIANPSTAVTFTQDFPALNFNTPPDTVKCNPSVNVTPDTTPFTDVVPQPDGSCKTIVAQGNKQQAAAGDMRNFQAVFTGSLQVAAPGRVTFNVYSDDGWILSMGPSGSGAQPGYVSGPMLNFPRVGPFTGYAIVGSYNVESAPNQNNLVVSFPSAGTYPFELDYSDCCAGTQALTVLANGVPIPPTTLDTAPAATVAPTVVATAVPVPTTIPVTTTVIPAQNGNAINPILIAAAAAIVLLLIGAVLLFLLVLRKPRQKPAPV